MRSNYLLLSLGVFALSMLPMMSARAANVELGVAIALNTTPNVRCPSKVTLTETSRPYREGSYAIDGSAKLNSLVEKMTIAASDEFSITWVAKLKPQYSQCKGTARMVKVGNEAYQGHSYLRLRFVGGKAYLILDMTGLTDANEYTPVILKKSVQNGNPIWSWGGTD